MQIDIANLFLWTDLLGILINVGFLLLGLWWGQKRGYKAGIQKKEDEAKDIMLTMLLERYDAEWLRRDD